MFKEVNQRQNFIKMEEELLSWWKKNDIVRKYLARNSKAQKHFSFIDGPITANNPMGLHHAWGRTYKDLWQRFKNMQGYEQRFQNGFDCQGLWVEVEVEKELGFNSKKDILDYGLDKFTNQCVARVKRFAQKQTEQSVRLGMFMDWENSYYTMSETNNLYIWRFLKKCQEDGMLYKSKSSTVWCPRCETGLSQHEQADGYKEITDVSVYVKFQVAGRENEYFLVWTTTPWTLTSNVLLAINTKHPYVATEVDGETWYVAEESAKRLGLEKNKPVAAKELLKLEFETLYPHIPKQKDVKHFVVDWDLVDPSEGTGIVHIAPGCGAEDYDLGKEVGADITLSPLDESGHFMDGYGDMVGKFAHDVTDEVIAYLKEQGSLYKAEEITHSYPHCWRCGTKSLFRLEDNWFINIEKIRTKLKEKAAEATWIPEFAGYRMQDWLNNMGDWMISRKRFYGLSLPFYECSGCGELVVVGSKEELKERAVNPEVVDSLPSLHRPWIDEVAITCPSCGKEVRRIQDVGDCWLDAGVVPFSTLKYFEDRSYWEKWFPANYIIEMIEQVRLWFYSMLVYGVMFENEVPYKVVGNYGEVRDENGIRFSKSKVNYIPFDEAAEKAGSDVIRWVYVTQSPGTNLRFGWSVTEDVRRRFYLPVWNLYCYLVTYANQHGFSPEKTQDKGSDSVMDRWVLAELNEVIERVTESLEAYDASTASRRIEQFVTDLSTWYVRRSRDRFMKGDLQALSTLYTVMTTLARLLAPFTPFIAEEMMRNLRRKDDPESIHLADFPESNSSWADPELTKTMKQARAVAALGQSARVSAGIRVRQPLSELQVSGVALEDELLRIIADEMNVKTVTAVRKVNEAEHWVVQKDKALTVSLNTELSGELMVEGLFRDVVRKVQQSRKDAGLKPGEPVKVTIVSQNDSVRELVSQKNEELKQSVSASDVVFTDAVPSEGSREHGISVTID